MRHVPTFSHRSYDIRGTNRPLFDFTIALRTAPHPVNYDTPPASGPCSSRRPSPAPAKTSIIHTRQKRDRSAQRPIAGRGVQRRTADGMPALVCAQPSSLTTAFQALPALCAPAPQAVRAARWSARCGVRRRRWLCAGAPGARVVQRGQVIRFAMRLCAVGVWVCGTQMDQTDDGVVGPE